MKAIKKVLIYMSAVSAIFLCIGIALCAFAAADENVQAPLISKIYNGENGIVIKWSAVADSTGYEVYRRTSPNKSWVKKAELSAKTKSYEDKDVKNAQTYYYAVRTVMQDGKGAQSECSLLRLSAVKMKSAVNTDGSVKLKWSENKLCDGYYVYRKTSPDDAWKRIATVSSGKTVTYYDKKVADGKSYIYAVKAYKNGVSGAIGSDNAEIIYISPVKNFSVKNSPAGVRLSWSRVSSANGYAVYRKVQGDTEWKKIATLRSQDKISYIDKLTSYGKKNYYKVRAYISNSKYSGFCPVASLYSVNPKKPMVALTYDDGPYRPATNKILDTLERYSGRATFFVVGSRLGTYKDCIVREAAMGCEVANHTYNHKTLTAVSNSVIKSEISKTDSLIKAYTGKSSRLVRAPGGSVNARVKSAVPYPLVNWSLDTLDWKNRNSATIIANVKKSVKDGSIILMHDLYMTTADASVTVIPWLTGKGYQLVTVPEMMDAKGIVMKSGILYTKAY